MHIYMKIHVQAVHLHQVLTVIRMSQINHYQDESNYALKRIDGKMYYIISNNTHSVPNHMYHVLLNFSLFGFSQKAI